MVFEGQRGIGADHHRSQSTCSHIDHQMTQTLPLRVVSNSCDCAHAFTKSTLVRLKGRAGSAGAAGRNVGHHGAEGAEGGADEDAKEYAAHP